MQVATVNLHKITKHASCASLYRGQVGSQKNQGWIADNVSRRNPIVFDIVNLISRKHDIGLAISLYDLCMYVHAFL